MKVKALVSFAGIVTMAKGEEREIKDSYVLKDLLRVGYVEEVKVKVSAEPKTKPKTRQKKVKADEN